MMPENLWWNPRAMGQANIKLSLTATVIWKVYVFVLLIQYQKRPETRATVLLGKIKPGVLEQRLQGYLIYQSLAIGALVWA